MLASIAQDSSFRAQLARAMFDGVKESPRVAVLVAEAIADRLEGRPIQKVEGLPQAVFYDASGPTPPGVTPPLAEKRAPPFEILE